LLLLVVLLALTTSGCREAAEEGIVLRFATTHPGEQLRESFHASIRQFEEAHPGVRVELIEMDDDVYQKMGLLTLFVGGAPPDVYFQWGGHLVRKYAAAGYALDLTDQFPPAERSRYHPAAWSSCTDRDGRIVLWPSAASVTTVMWYRKSLFRKAGIEPPQTWDDFLRGCEALKSVGVTPIAVGNRELWAGGNFAAYLAAQRAGVERYKQVLGLAPGTTLEDPAFVEAFEALAQLEARGFLNRGVAGVGADEARSLLLQGRAAMHPIGDWLVSEADPAEVGDLGCFLLPPLPGQATPEPALLALTTGYMVHRNSRHLEEARALAKHLGSEAVQREWSRHGHLSARRAAAPGVDAPEGQRQLLRLLEGTPATAIAPDVGFDQEVSDAFLDAVSLIFGNRATPREALAGAERQVRALRQGTQL
jgi:ABC-type glycerol-3-phosphate transport system substrate-binding protein